MKIKPKKIFNTCIFCLFVLFVSLYIASNAGYYEYQNKEKVKFTEEKMKEFEEDLKLGKKVDIKDYLTSNTKNYDNKVTELGLTLSDIVNNGIINGLEKTFRLVEKLIE